MMYSRLEPQVQWHIRRHDRHGHTLKSKESTAETSSQDRRWNVHGRRSLGQWRWRGWCAEGSRHVWTCSPQTTAPRAAAGSYGGGSSTTRDSRSGNRIGASDRLRDEHPDRSPDHASYTSYAGRADTSHKSSSPAGAVCSVSCVASIPGCAVPATTDAEEIGGGGSESRKRRAFRRVQQVEHS